ncbi:hypothetical protein N9R54_00215 [Pelobium sp.]|nr:hypothetical protein [Pelobium sp.]MDA9554631.1 hypothetical protein [Pelobium sp.]
MMLYIYNEIILTLKTKLSIKLKSALLLTVFLLNTLVIFACSLGMDMKFNVTHHQQSEVEPAHSHNKDEQHHHSKKEKDNCCKDEAVKFATVNKLIPLTADFSFQPLFVPVAIFGFDIIGVSETNVNTSSNNFYFLTYQPPIPDIRVAIQSFQI